jgi:hypothetical protein
MTAPQKQCAPGTVAAAPGTSPEDEGADRPTPHASTVATTPAGHKRRTCVLVWRKGMLQVPAESIHLRVLQLALITQAQHPPS